MEDSVAARLKLFIDTTGLTSSQFADMCGIPRPTLSQLLSGRNKKISDVIVGQIHHAFSELSVVWLLFGEGPVKLSSTNVCEASNDKRIDDVKDLAGGKDVCEFSNLGGLKQSNSLDNPSNNQVFESDLKILDLQRQIEKLKQNPRKVVQITIYYDDSTFETFVPKG